MNKIILTLTNVRCSTFEQQAPIWRFWNGRLFLNLYVFFF